MSINLAKITETVVLLLSKDEDKVHQSKLSRLLLLVDTHIMDRYILPLTDDCITCFKHEPPILRNVDTFITKGFTSYSLWTKRIKHSKEKGELYFQLIHPRTETHCEHLNQTEINEINFVQMIFGNFTVPALDTYLYDLSVDWRDKESSEFNSYLFFKSLRFSETECRHRQRFFEEHFSEGKHTLHEVIANRQKLV